MARRYLLSILFLLYPPLYYSCLILLVVLDKHTVNILLLTRFLQRPFEIHRAKISAKFALFRKLLVV